MKNSHFTENKNQQIDKFMTSIFWLIGILTVGFLILLTGYIIFQGIKGFYPELLSSNSSGIINQLFNTIYLVFLSLLISVPIGTGAGYISSRICKSW